MIAAAQEKLVRLRFLCLHFVPLFKLVITNSQSPFVTFPTKLKLKHVCEISYIWLSDAGLRIKLSTIRIPSRPNSIVYYNTNPIPRWRLSWRSRIPCNYELFLIKVNRFWLISDLKINLSPLKDQKYWVKDQKHQLKDQNCRFILKKSIYFGFSL